VLFKSIERARDSWWDIGTQVRLARPLPANAPARASPPVLEQAPAPNRARGPRQICSATMFDDARVYVEFKWDLPPAWGLNPELTHWNPEIKRSDRIDQMDPDDAEARLCGCTQVCRRRGIARCHAARSVARRV
jgi:hypothetical protein